MSVTSLQVSEFCESVRKVVGTPYPVEQAYEDKTRFSVGGMELRLPIRPDAREAFADSEFRNGAPIR